MATITVDINTQELQNQLYHLQLKMGDLTPIMASIRQELMSQTEMNFMDEGLPKWAALAPATIEQRKKSGHWPGAILQQSGTLARSLVAQSDATSAMIGVGPEVKYAAIHQFGGMAGRRNSVAIPARPYLPIVGSALTPQAEESIKGILTQKLNKLLSNEN